MAILTLHHWTNLAGGLSELRRVSGRQIVLVFEPRVSWQFWQIEYFAECLSLPSEQRAPNVEDVGQHLGIQTVVPVPVPADCILGFAGAYWCRLEQYLNSSVRAESRASPSYH